MIVLHFTVFSDEYVLHRNAVQCGLCSELFFVFYENSTSNALSSWIMVSSY